MLLKDTLIQVLQSAAHPIIPRLEVPRGLHGQLPESAPEAVIFKGVRRSGKSTLMLQEMRTREHTLFCNFEDTRLFGFSAEDFPRFIECVEELIDGPANLFLDEIQEVERWEQLVRALLDRGHHVWATGSNASLLSRDVGAKLTGRHRSFAIFPFNYSEYLAFRQKPVGPDSLGAFLEEGGFPGFLEYGDVVRLQELLRDVIQRDIALRHELRETRHLMNLCLFLIAHSGQPFSQQKLSRILQIPSAGQVGNYLEYLDDAYLLLGLPKKSHSFKKRVVAPKKYYPIDNGLARANSPQTTPDRGRRLENQVFLALRQAGIEVAYDAETDLWECDFVTENEAIQVCWQLTEENRQREIEGLRQASHRAQGKIERCRILTFDQADRIETEGVTVQVQPTWEWLLEMGL
jgi:predicted AAA+ superfamily ATPase